MCRAGLNTYCDACHRIADHNARTNGTIMNWQPLLLRDQARWCEHTRAGARPCPLGAAPHPKHGVKYAMGCQTCKMEAESLRWETEGGGGGGGKP
jgi:hypothetical protein